MALLGLAFLLVPLGSAQAAIPGCAGDPAPMPQRADSGTDGLLVPPQSAASIEAAPDSLPPDASLYGQYGMAGQQWHTIRSSCIDGISGIPQTTMANTAWDLSKTINQATITVYQAATTEGLLDNFNEMVRSVIHELREGIWRPLLPTLIILGAVWLGWVGLVRKRLTLTLESAVWMVAAITLGIWVLLQPNHMLNLSSTLVNSGTQLVNSAANQVALPISATTCPLGSSEPERADWESESDFAVRKNSQMLWNGLTCQPWRAGQFGQGEAADAAELEHGMALLEAQGISRIELQQIADGELDSEDLVQEKQEAYEDIASGVESNYPEIYPLFSGDVPGERIAIASLALFAAIFGGGLILAGSVALIVLKIGFLILLLLAPVFLLIGVHPGFGRVILLRWVEMMLGLLLKQIFVVLLIALLTMAYGMVMAMPLSWGLQVILLSLFTLAVFVYRKPFAHLFASVNANTFTSRMVSDAMTSSVLSKSAVVLPPVAYLRAQKWGLRNAPQLGAIAAGTPVGGREAADGEVAGRPGLDTADTGAQESGRTDANRSDAGRARGQAGYGRVRGGTKPPPLPLGQNSGDSGSRGMSGRSSAQAPRLSDLAAPASGAGGSSGGERIPPRPPGGYTGRGSSNWGDIFGTSSSSASRPTERPSMGSGGGSGGGTGAGSQFDGRGVAAPRTDDSVMRGRRPTPPQGNGGGGWRWGGGRGRERPAPPPPRGRSAASPRHSSGDEGGTWFSGSKSGQADRPSTPFWAETGTRRRDVERDVPFWLRDDD